MKTTRFLSAIALFSGLSFAQTLDPVSLEQLVNTDVPTTQYNPEIATDDNGNYLIVWQNGNSAGEIIARRYDNTHTAVSPEIIINASDAQDINVHYWKNDTYVISYRETSGNHVKFTTLDGTNTVGSEISVITNNRNYDFDLQGDSIAFGYSEIASNSQVYLRGYNLGTNSWINSAVLVSEDSGNGYQYPKVIYHPDATITMIYYYRDQYGGTWDVNNNIMRKPFNSSFLALQPESFVFTADHEVFVITDMDAEGNDLGEVIITTNHGTVFSSRLLRLWILDANGTVYPNTNGVDLMPINISFYSDVRCQLYNDGNYAIVSAHGYGGTVDVEAEVLYGENYNSSNSGWLAMNATSSGRQNNPCIAKLPNGGFVAAWDGNGFQGDTEGIYSRAYNAIAFPGVKTVTSGSYQVDETGSSISIDVSLNTQPTGNVTVDITSTNTAEGTVNTTQLNFTNANWDQPQTIVVTGVDDVMDDGDITFFLEMSTGNSADATYSGLTGHEVSVVNLDNDATMTMPSNQTFCKSQGMSGVNALISNVGSPITSVVGTSSDQAIVDDSDISINDLGGGTYEVVIANLGNNNTGTAQITLTANDGNFDYTDQFDVTTTGVAITTMATANTICEGDSVSLLATGAQNLSWDNNVINNEYFIPQGTGSFDYTVTGDDGNGCGGTATETIVVNPAPAVPTITYFGGDLISSSATGNQWYFNGNIIPTETDQTIVPVQEGTYIVEVTINGCSSSSDPYVHSIAGIEENENSFVIYPNPTTGLINVKGLTAGMELVVFDVIGNEVKTISINSSATQIDLSNLAKGPYYFKFISTNSTETKKVVLK